MTSVLLVLCPKTWATTPTNLTLGQTQTGTITTAAEANSYTFSASAKDVVSITVAATSGNLSPMLRLANSSGTVLDVAYPSLPGGACRGTSTLEINTFLLTAAGTYTVLVTDCSAANTGSYTIYAQLTDNPAGASTLPSGPTETGTINSAAQSNSYTFSATVNDFVSLTMSTTSGILSPKFRLYDSAGALLTTSYPGYPNACTGAATTGLSTYQLPATGTFTVLVGDCTDVNTGNYQISAQLANPLAVPGLPLGETDTGTISSAAQSNRYSLIVNANDVVEWTAVTTSGSLSPKIQLYNSVGTLLLTSYPNNGNSACNGSGTLESSYQFSAAGTYTVLFSDCGATNTGSYAFYTQLTTNPSGAAALPFGQVVAGLIGSTAQSDTYTFTANANDVVDFSAIARSGSVSPKLRLYSSAGTLLRNSYPNNGNSACNGGSSVESNTFQFPATGTYTLLFGDCSDGNIGNYAIFADLTNNPSGPVGILWGQVQPGQVANVVQSKSYTFAGSASDVVDFTVVATTGSFSPKLRLYNPDGSLLSTAYPNNGNSACNGGGTIQMNSVMLTQNGAYTLLLGDCSDVNIGTYNLSSQCFGTCPLSAPVITSISPTTAVAGGSGFTLTVNGSNFVNGPPSTVDWNGAPLTTTYVSSTQLTATVPASDLLAGGIFPITVENPLANVGPSNAVNFTVSGSTPTITFATLPSQIYGAAPFPISATSSSGLAITFTSLTTPICTVSGTTVTIVSAGTCTIQASSSGATSVSQSFQVTQASPTINFPPISNQVIFSPPLSISATASSGLVSFTSLTPLICSVTGNTITLIAVGTCTIQASVAGNTDYLAATVSQSFQVTQESQTIAFGPLPNQTFGTAPFTVSATANANEQFTQEGGKLVGTGATGYGGYGYSGLALQGYAVAVSADGNTAIVGGFNDGFTSGSGGLGAAWVFTRSGGVWTQQGSKLVGTGAVGNADQGDSVAISADGSTVIMGGSNDDGGAGAVWVFTFSGGVWTQQGSKLVGTGAVGNAAQGSSVALSSDGNTAIVGGYTDDGGAGAVWVYTRSGGVWTQLGSKLVGTGAVGNAGQGRSVALSSDGSTAMVGGYNDNGGAGAAWVFTFSGGLWTQQGSKLVGTGAVGNAIQGFKVALSGEGSTAIVGGYDDNGGVGAAWVFTQSAGSWTQQGNKLVGTGATGNADQGTSVALSADGNTALVGGPCDNTDPAGSCNPGYNGPASFTQGIGAAWAYTRSGGAWTQLGSKLVGTGAIGYAMEGFSVALSGDGSTAVLGGGWDNVGCCYASVGAAWAFARPADALVVSFNSQTPLVCSVSGTTVTLLSVGTCTIQATQAGNADYLPATSANQSFQVTQASQTITFGTLQNQLLGTPPFTVSATASSGLAVSFNSQTTGVCTVSGATGSTVTLVAVGTCIIQATQSGNADYFAATSVPQSFMVMQLVLQALSVESIVSAGPGSAFSIPVTLALSNGTSLASLTFGVQITPVGNAPALTGSLTFTAGPSVPAPSLNNPDGPNEIAVGWESLTSPFTGIVTVGSVSGMLPAGAVSGQSYTVTVTGVTGAANGNGTNPIPINPGPSGALNVAVTYLVGDIAPSNRPDTITSDTAPNFGDGILNISDLVQELFAIDGVPGYVPLACTDRFDAADTFPVDTSTNRGGDGILDIRDLVEELFRVDNLDPSRPIRASLGGCADSSASTAKVVTARAITPKHSGDGDVDGGLEFGAPEPIGLARERVPVFLYANRDLSGVALTFAVGDQISTLDFVSALNPTVANSQLKGVAAVAWLGGLNVQAHERLLLGYIEAPLGSSGGVQIYGLSAGRLSDNTEVILAAPGTMGSSR